jgi:stearoyl-CoA desaturase (Delta-9 desaturase)
VGHGGGWRGALKGLWHAHVGWLFRTVGLADLQRYARDLLADRAVRAMDRLFWLWVVLGFAIPFAIGWLVGGTLGTGLTALVWGGLVRVFLLHHVTWSINSVCHFFGRRRSAPTTSPATSSGWRRSPSASPGTTTTTRSRAPPSTAAAARA